MYELTPAGLLTMPVSINDMRRNWLRWRRTLFLPLPARAWRRCSGSLAACRSSSPASSTRLAPGSFASLARPGGNTTGFTAFEYSISGKWLELLKADGARREARQPSCATPRIAAGIGQYAAIQAAAAAARGTELRPIDPREAWRDRARHLCELRARAQRRS